MEAIRGWYKRRHKWQVTKNAILLGSGVVTSIHFTIQAITDQGDKILVFSPVYDPFFAVIHNTGRTVVDLPLVKKQNK